MVVLKNNKFFSKRDAKVIDMNMKKIVLYFVAFIGLIKAGAMYGAEELQRVELGIEAATEEIVPIPKNVLEIVVASATGGSLSYQAQEAIFDYLKDPAFACSFMHKNDHLVFIRMKEFSMGYMAQAMNEAGLIKEDILSVFGFDYNKRKHLLSKNSVFDSLHEGIGLVKSPEELLLSNVCEDADIVEIAKSMSEQLKAMQDSNGDTRFSQENIIVKTMIRWCWPVAQLHEQGPAQELSPEAPKGSRTNFDIFVRAACCEEKLPAEVQDIIFGYNAEDEATPKTMRCITPLGIKNYPARSPFISEQILSVQGEDDDGTEHVLFCSDPNFVMPNECVSSRLVKQEELVALVHKQDNKFRVPSAQEEFLNTLAVVIDPDDLVGAV